MMNPSMLISILIVLCVCYFAGSLLLAAFKIRVTENDFYDAFIRLTTGFLTTTFLYALVITSGNTVLWGFVLAGILTFMRVRNGDYGNEVKYIGHFIDVFKLTRQKSLAIFTFLILGIIYFIFQGSFFYGDPFNHLPHGDYTGYYTKITEFLNAEGVETRKQAIYLSLDKEPYPEPYHYPELWLGGMIARFSGVLVMESLVVATHAILAVILSIGMISLSRSIISSIFMQVFSVFTILFYGIILINFLPQTESFVIANGWNIKNLIISIFFVWFVQLFITKNKYFYLPLLILPVLNIALAPPVFVSIVLMAGWTMLFRTKEKFFNPTIVIVDTFIMAIFIGGFYFLNAGGDATGDFSISNIIAGHTVDPLKPFKIIAGTILIVLSLYVIYIIPPLALLYLTGEVKQSLKKLKDFFVFFIIIFFSGLFFWSLMHPIHDSTQFFYLPALILLNIVITVLIFYTYKVVKSKGKSYLIPFFVYLLIMTSLNYGKLSSTPFYNYQAIDERYSPAFIHALTERLDKWPENHELIGLIRHPEDIHGYWQAFGYSAQDGVLRLFVSRHHTINLDAFNTPLHDFNPIDSMRVLNTLKQTPFYEFGISRLDSVKVEDIPKLQHEYILKKQIKYLMISERGEIPVGLQPLIDTVMTNQVTGYRFVFLKYND